jgi:tRNA modification GTPase
VNLDDTIVAIATPPGRGGIGVVRLAGPEARAIAAPMLWLKHPLEAGRAIFGELIEPADNDVVDRGQAAKKQGPRTGVSAPHDRIDEVVVTYFAKPHSYTTDDIIEIASHGSPVVLRHVVELAIARGARLAEPGEFTMRAFLNGRIDLTQAEAVRDLIEAQTVFQAKVAAQQLEGALSRRLKPIKQHLVELIAQLEAGIDFAEDDVTVLADATILEGIERVRRPLWELGKSFAYGKIVHQGLMLAIVGRPNVGKSSLFNRLVEHERAIVTATPGTTRDLVSETVAIGGIPVKLVDTAGIRRALDEAESIGIRKSIEALAEADLVLVVLDVSQPVAAEDWEVLAHVKGRGAIVVENKADLASSQFSVLSSQLSDLAGSRFLEKDSVEIRLAVSETGPAPSLPAHPAPILGSAAPRIRTSAVTGEGIENLRAEILRHIGGETGGQEESGFLTNVRHQGLVRDSLLALEAAKTAVANKIPHEMLLLDLYNALRPLDEISGATTTDDILNLIFSTFCIGK